MTMLITVNSESSAYLNSINNSLKEKNEVSNLFGDSYLYFIKRHYGEEVTSYSVYFKLYLIENAAEEFKYNKRKKSIDYIVPITTKDELEFYLYSSLKDWHKNIAELVLRGITKIDILGLKNFDNLTFYCDMENYIENKGISFDS